jgi:hypothetical protein
MDRQADSHKRNLLQPISPLTIPVLSGTTLLHIGFEALSSNIPQQQSLGLVKREN